MEIDNPLLLTTRFTELANSQKLWGDLHSLLKSERVLNLRSVSRREWICMETDDKPINNFEDLNIFDLDNLIGALNEKGVKKLYSIPTSEILSCNIEDVSVLHIPVKHYEIIYAQTECTTLDIFDSVLFAEFPLDFIILRPDTSAVPMFFAGEANFIKDACVGLHWQKVEVLLTPIAPLR